MGSGPCRALEAAAGGLEKVLASLALHLRYPTTRRVLDEAE